MRARLRPIVRGLRALVRRRDTDRDIADEVQHYLHEAAAAHRARGLGDADAWRAAHIELGGVTRVQEAVRDAGWEHVVEELRTDLRYAARRLLATPAFTISAGLTLAVGIGGTTAIWSAVDAVLFRALPYPRSDRIVAIADRADDGARIDVTFGTYRELVARTHSVDVAAVFKPWRPTAAGRGAPERLEGQRVSAAYFRVLGVAPAIGRGFLPFDDRPGAPDVAVVSDGLWRRRFGGDPGLIGRPITLDDKLVTVVGIMPSGFDDVTAPHVEIWAPLQYDMSQGSAWGHHLHMIARARPSVPLADVARDLDAIARDPSTEFPRAAWARLERGLAVTPLRDDLTAPYRSTLLAILGAVALVLAIVCVNVTNLLLARGAQRRGEFALRAALGAGRSRLVRQLLAEGMLLATIGGAVAMAVAYAGLGAIVRLSPPELPRISSITIQASTFAACLAITTLLGLAIGIVPAVQASRADPGRDLHQASRRSSSGHRQVRAMLVVAEVALSVLLLVVSGLLLRSVEQLLGTPAGFDATGLVTMQVQTTGRRFVGDGATARYFRNVVAAVRGVPGVADAALTSQLPLSGDVDLYGARIEPSVAQDPGEVRGTYRYAVSDRYFETMRIAIRAGRAFRPADAAGGPPVAIISESMAKRRLPGLDPIGRQIRIGAGTTAYTIVGVAGDVRQESLALSHADAVYLPFDQWEFPDRAMSVVVRERGDAAVPVPLLRAAIWSVDRDQPIVRVTTMDRLVEGSAANRRFALRLFELFALAALVLAAAGIHGVLAGSVAERAREIGVRAALGADRGRIVGLVVGQGLRMTALGVALGMVGAVGGTRVVRSLLFGVSPLDPITYVAVVVVLAAVAAVACAVPALRAARIDPVETLRAD